MSNYKITDTVFEYNVLQDLVSRGYNWKPEYTLKATDILFKSIARYLASSKSKDKETAVVIKTIDGEFLLGAILKYEESPEKDPTIPPSWNFTFTFNEDDLRGITNVVLSSDYVFSTVFSSTGKDLGGMTLETPAATDIVSCTILMHLKKMVFSIVSNEQTEVNIYNTDEEDPDIFILTGKPNGESVEYSMVPGSELKRIIKGDAKFEK